MQMNSGGDKHKNIARAKELVQEAIAHHARFILLPEVFNFRGSGTIHELPRRISEFIPGESLRPLISLAKAHRVNILAGSVYEKAEGTKKIYNTSVLIDEQGKIEAKYRKINLFDAVIGRKVIKESKVFGMGRKVAVGQVENFKIGLSVCYDLRFPRLYKRYAAKGADVFCVPASFTRITGQAHWEILLRARAIENLCYVLAPNQVGKDGKQIASYGHSMIIDPWGKILAEASGHQEEVIYARLEREVLNRARKMFPDFK